MKFEKLTADRFKPASDGKRGEMRLFYADMVRVFGEPIDARAAGFDDGKVDVIWNYRGFEGGVEVGGFEIWNYKNGPVYHGAGSIETLATFSIGFFGGRGQRVFLQLLADCDLTAAVRASFQLTLSLD